MLVPMVLPHDNSVPIRLKTLRIAMTYIAIKHLHVTAAALSIILFIIRACWSVKGSPLLQTRFARVAPLIIDRILLLAVLYLLSVLGANQPWVVAKIVGLIL